MSCQPLRHRTLFRLLLHCLRQLRNHGAEAVQQFQQIPPASARPGRQREPFQLLPSRFTPQPFLAPYSFIESYRLQLIHQARTRLHHAVAMPEQLAHVAILPARYPDPRKAVFQQQPQEKLRVPAIRLLLANALRPNLGCIPNP